MATGHAATNGHSMTAAQSLWIPTCVAQLEQLGIECGWWALVEYRTPAYKLRLWQQRETRSGVMRYYVVEFRNRGGWRAIWAREQIHWNPKMVTERDVTLAEIRNDLRGL